MTSRLDPGDVRTPTQLTAAWFATLLLLVSALLGACLNAPVDPAWLGALFGIAAVAIIPIFVIAVFLLQTYFRTQMLSDEHFARFQASVIDATSRRGQAIEAAEATRVARRAVRNGGVVRGARLLWVDDVPAGIDLEKDMLAKLGFSRIDVVTSTAQAVERLEREVYDLVITDMERDGDRAAGLDLIARVPDGGPPVVVYLGDLRPELGVPKGAFGVTDRPDRLVHLVLDALETTRNA